MGIIPCAFATLDMLRVESYRELSQNFAQQVSDQKAQVENLKSALRQLDQKLTEAQAKSEVLIAQHRRARAVEADVDPQWADEPAHRVRSRLIGPRALLAGGTTTTDGPIPVGRQHE